MMNDSDWFFRTHKLANGFVSHFSRSIWTKKAKRVSSILMRGTFYKRRLIAKRDSYGRSTLEIRLHDGPTFTLYARDMRALYNVLKAFYEVP